MLLVLLQCKNDAVFWIFIGFSHTAAIHAGCCSKSTQGVWCFSHVHLPARRTIDTW